MTDQSTINPCAAVAATLIGNLPLHDAETLTSGGTCAAIMLRDQLYTLRITRAGKLILTK